MSVVPYAAAPAVAPLPRPRWIYLRWIWEAWRQGDRDPAQAYRQDLWEFSSRQGHAWFLFGQRLAQRGDQAQAEMAYREAVRRDPNLIEAHCYLLQRWEYYHEQDPERSPLWQGLVLEAYRYLATLDPDNFSAWQTLGEALERDEIWAEALATFQYAHTLDPTNPWSVHRIANCYRALGEWESAITAYQRAIALDPTFLWNHVALGNLLGDQNRWPLAKDSYDQALALDPSFLWSYIAFGDRLMEQEQWALASDIYGQAIAQNPAMIHDLGDRFLQSLVHHPELSPTEAMERYRYRIPATDLTAQLQGDFWLLNQQMDNPAFHRTVGDRLVAMDRPGEAIAYYKIALALNPDHPQTQRSLDYARQVLPLSPAIPD